MICPKKKRSEVFRTILVVSLPLKQPKLTLLETLYMHMEKMYILIHNQCYASLHSFFRFLRWIFFSLNIIFQTILSVFTATVCQIQTRDPGNERLETAPSPIRAVSYFSKQKLLPSQEFQIGCNHLKKLMKTILLNYRPAIISVCKRKVDWCLPSFNDQSSIPTKPTLGSHTHSFLENKLSWAVIWQDFAIRLCFQLLFRQLCGGLTQLNLLLVADWKAQAWDSKSFLWDEIEYLPAGVTQWPSLGLKGSLWYSWTPGTLGMWLRHSKR